MKIDLKRTQRVMKSLRVPSALGNHCVIETRHTEGQCEHINIVMWGGHKQETKNEETDYS